MFSEKIMGDMWSKIPGYNNYSISSNGQVRNDKRGICKQTTLNRYGYPVVDLYANGERETFRIHRLVANAYVDNPYNKPQVNHIDGNKRNNSYENLEWCTPSENMQHAILHGLCKPKPPSMLGRKNPNAGRPRRPIRIIETGEEFNSIMDCERAINGSNKHIADCLAGRQKTHKGYHFEYI